MTAAWCGLSDDDDDDWQQCSDCLEWFEPDTLIHHPHEDFVYLCRNCWKKEREAHPEWYGGEDDGQ